MQLTRGRPATRSPLVEVRGFGRNPTGLRMHLYVPQRLAARPAIVLAVHNCTESGERFATGPAAEFVALAEKFGYLLIFPTATRPGACFDVSSPAALHHDGNGDPAGIVAMIRYLQRSYGRGEVFVIGLSSGAMMSHVLLGAHPEVFTAGAAFAGVPFAGFATESGSWNEDCAQGRLIRSPREWGDLVRSSFPGHSGPWPRIQMWHSTTDDIIDHRNLAEAVKQWTDVHGVPQLPAAVDHPRPAWRRFRYGGAGRTAAVEAISVSGSPHNVLVPGMARYTLAFFGLAHSV